MKSKIALIGCGGRSELAVEFHRPDLGAELVAAADPATASEPKLFMAAWIHTLAKEKTIPWIPAGTPIRSMARSSFR